MLAPENKKAPRGRFLYVLAETESVRLTSNDIQSSLEIKLKSSIYMTFSVFVIV